MAKKQPTEEQKKNPYKYFGYIISRMNPKTHIEERKAEEAAHKAELKAIQDEIERPEREEQERRQRLVALLSLGRMGTIMTGPQGAFGRAPVRRKTLLGGP